MEQLGWQHFLVCFDHQRRTTHLLGALFHALMRFLVVRGMVGLVDEYVHEDRVVAWAHTVVKGNTLRAMWFYQRSSVSRSVCDPLSSCTMHAVPFIPRSSGGGICRREEVNNKGLTFDMTRPVT